MDGLFYIEHQYNTLEMAQSLEVTTIHRKEDSVFKVFRKCGNDLWRWGLKTRSIVYYMCRQTGPFVRISHMEQGSYLCSKNRVSYIKTWLVEDMRDKLPFSSDTKINGLHCDITLVYLAGT